MMLFGIVYVPLGAVHTNKPNLCGATEVRKSDNKANKVQLS